MLVDFWAPWCGPCRVLGPVLEKLEREAGGAWELAKVDTEQHPTLGARFGVRSIPAVKLFVDGAPVAEFVGALPEGQVRAFLDQHIPSEADELARAAVVSLAAGEVDDAKAALQRAVALQPDHAAAHLTLARIALAEGDAAAVERHAAAVPMLAPEAEAAGHVRDALAFANECRGAGGEAACRDRVASAPDDLDARYALACCHATAGRYRDALEGFLAIVAASRKFRDDAARKAMLTVFGLVGTRSDLANEFRRELAIYL